MTKKENNSSLPHQQEDWYHKLSIQVGLDGLSFCILDTIGNKLVLSYAKAFENQLDPYRLQQELREAFREQGVLEYRFSEVVAIHRNLLFSLVPQALFDPAHLADYIKFNAKILPTDHLEYDPIDGLEITNVYVPFTNVNNYLYDLFGEFEFKHAATVLMETFLKLPSSAQGTICYVHLAESQMDLAVFSQKKLRFFNSYAIGSETDFMYYLLFTLEQLGLEPSSQKLRLLGEVEEGDPYFEIAASYVENVSVFAPAGAAFPIGTEQAGIDFTLINSL